MRIRFLPRIDEYERTYSVNGDIIQCAVSGQADSVDLSDLEHGDKLVSVETDLPCGWLVDAKRDENGVVWVTLYEQVPAGVGKHYDYSEWFDGLPAELPPRGFHSVDLNSEEAA